MMARRLVALCGAVAFAAAVQLAACASFSSDASSEPDSAIASDTSSALDAAADVATDVATDVAPGFCASHVGARLCADFDEGDPVTFHFVDRNGEPTVDKDAFISPPAAMRTVTSASATFVIGQASGAELGNAQRLSFDTYQGALGGDGGLTTDSILGAIVEGASTCSFTIESFGDSARLNVNTLYGDGGTGYETYPLSAYPPPGRWAHVELLLEAKEGRVAATVTIDKIVALVPRATNCPALATDARVYIGLVGSAVGAPTTGEARYDNVLFDGK